ncbi:MAG: potassium transporter TrkG [Kiritimatiellia bacterium]|jgi:trk system potassium uptake protein TrkH
MRAIFKNSKPRRSPERLLAMSFAAAIAIGAILLATPAAHLDGRWHVGIDALFLSTSAVCVTGLDPIGIGASLSRFGLGVVLLLVELGGLGIMTVGTFFFIAMGRRLSRAEEDAVMSALGEGRAGNVAAIIRSTLVFALSWEIAGGALLARCLHANHGLPIAEALWQGAFMSVMAFCNAGFTIAADSMIPYAHDAALLGALLALMIAGGLGFIVHTDLLAHALRRKPRTSRRLSLHTRLVLMGTGVVLAIGTATILALEGSNAFDAFPFPGKALGALFQTATSRTTGFAAVPTTSLRAATTILVMGVMFVGAAPGSTGGGIKITTAVVLFAVIRDMLRNRDCTEICERAVPRRVVVDAIAITLLSLAVVGGAVFILSWTEEGSGLAALPLVFETVSAFTTTGLSLGVTASLSALGKGCIILCMFIGRLGPVTLALSLSSRQTVPGRRYPEENVIVG